MKTERIIKQHARESMRGNMSVLIAAMGMVALSFLLLEYIEYLVLYFLKAVNFDTGEIIGDKKLIYYIVTAAATVLILLVSPLLNGFLRTAAHAALHRESQAVDVFCFFKSPKLYFKTVLYNFLLAVLFLTVSGALNINTYLETFAPDWYHQDPAWNTDTVLKVIAGVCTLFIKLVVYMVFVHYPLTAHALDDNTSVKEGVFVMLAFSVKNFGKLFKLVLSFMGWFALCFFVVPAIYVIPYFSVAALTSANWLFKIDKRGGGI